MAATAEAARLTEAHRLAQLRVGADTVAKMLLVWPLLDVNDLDGSFARWLATVLPLIGLQRRQSAILSATYLTAFRALELGVDAEPAAPVLAEEIPTPQVAASMLANGPAHLKGALSKGVALGRAVELAQAGSARAAMRHAMNGGRDTITNSVGADRSAVGWSRTSSAKACSFCAMLASRGPVYRGRTVRFRAHDGCSCGAEPVYRRDADWPASARHYQQLWNTATKGLHGDEARNAFRRALEAPA